MSYLHIKTRPIYNLRIIQFNNSTYFFVSIICDWVENIRNQFSKIAATKGQTSRQFQKIKELNEQKDTYKFLSL